MKKRVFQWMEHSVYRVIVITEDWSEGDRELMDQFGEPEINVGGEVAYAYEEENKVHAFGDEYMGIRRGFPYSRGFDSRDFSSVDEAVAVGKAWKELILGRIDAAVVALRQKATPLPTEEISEI